MIKKIISTSRYGLTLGTLVILAGCASSESVPFTIQSDPLGGHVIYQVNTKGKDSSTDWIYLGKTPIDIKRQISRRDLKKAEAFRIKVFKNGYHDQVRDWNGGEIEEEIDEKGHLFWNPKLVPDG
jgi:hypothetical protein